MTSSGASGYTGRYTVRNAGTTDVSGWRLEFDLLRVRNGLPMLIEPR